jgi:hypothetical protein
MPEVTVSVSPCAPALGEPITVTLTNHSTQTITLPSSCVFQAVSPGDCSSAPVFAPICLTVLVPIPPGSSASMTWAQVDNLGAQVPAGTYAFHVNYFDGAFAPFSCCPTVEVCSSPPTQAMEVSRAGTPPNPAAFLPGVTTAPIVGRTWDPVIDHASFLPAAAVDLVAVTLAPANLPIPPYGTLLCDVLTPPLMLFTSPGPGAPFSIPIPCSCDLIGLGLCSQGASVDAGGATVLLTNALDITIGTH